MTFSPPKSVGLATSVATFTLIVLLDAYGAALVRLLPPSFLTFGLICLILASLLPLAWLGYSAYALARARYVLSRNALVVDWGGRRELIPMEAITEARAGVDVEGRLRPGGIPWPGYVVGRTDIPPFGDVEFLATTGKSGLVLVGYADHWLALSPADPQAFLSEFEARRVEGVLEKIEPESVRPGFQQWALWHDRLALTLIALGGVSALLLVAYLIYVFPQFSAKTEIALHFNAQGQPDRFGAPAGLFILPVIAGLTWTLNTIGGVWLHRREHERTGAYLLFGATVFVQGLVWVAAISLLTAGRS